MYVESFLLLVFVAAVVPYVCFGVVNSLLNPAQEDDRKVKNKSSTLTTLSPTQKVSHIATRSQAEKITALVRRDVSKKSALVVSQKPEKTDLIYRGAPVEKPPSLKTGVKTKIQDK